jgi:hypothetical protein
MGWDDHDWGGGFLFSFLSFFSFCLAVTSSAAHTFSFDAGGVVDGWIMRCRVEIGGAGSLKLVPK